MSMRKCLPSSKSQITGMLYAGLAASSLCQPAYAQAGASQRPVPLDKRFEEGQGLEALPGWPAALIVKPIASHKIVSWYKGPELTAVVYEVSGGTIRLANLPYDEHARVLKGRAILTSLDGTTDVFVPGDTFVVPRGWSGTWQFDAYLGEMTFESDSLAKAMKELFDK